MHAFPNIVIGKIDSLRIPIPPGPRLMTDTQHSTLKTQCIWMGESWVWSENPECRVLRNYHKFWVQALNLWRFISTLHFKLQHQLHVFEWGILKCGRVHILCSGIPNLIHGVLSVECWVSVISLGPDIFKNFLRYQMKLCNFNCKFIFNNYLSYMISYWFNHMIHFCLVFFLSLMYVKQMYWINGAVLI